MSCHDTDTLIELSRVLGSDPRASLDHLSECEACMNTVVASAGIRAGYTGGKPVRAGFTDEVLDHLPFGDSPRPSRLWTFIEPVLASVTVIAAAAVASTSAPMEFNASTLAVAGLAGLAATFLLRASAATELG